MASQFDEIAPSLQDLAIPYRGVTVVALLFETDRAPFVVKNPKPGPVDWEVPWREGTMTRSARRTNLVRLLSGLTSLPDVELLGASLTTRPSDEANNSLRWRLAYTVYISPESDRTVIPFHRCKAEIQLPALSISFPLEDIRLAREQVFEMPTFQPLVSSASDRPPKFVASEAVIEHPSRFIA